MKSAKVFILTQIIYVSESEKPIQQSMRANPTTRVMLNVFEYDPISLSYTPVGRSALLYAAKSLHMNVSDYVTSNASCKTLDHLLISELSEYVPFHADMDLSSRIDGSTSQAIPPDDRDSTDPYIVEKILKKRYNSHKVQYEYFVKWQGYLPSENTWGLPPQSLLEAYERSLLQKQCMVENEPRRHGLRDRSTRKVTERNDYILNT